MRPPAASIRASAWSTRAVSIGESSRRRASIASTRSQRSVHDGDASSCSASERCSAGSRSRRGTIRPRSSDSGTPNSRRAAVGVRSTCIPSWWPSCSTMANASPSPATKPPAWRVPLPSQADVQPGPEVDDHHDPGFGNCRRRCRPGDRSSKPVSCRTYRRSGAHGIRLVGTSGSVTTISSRRGRGARRVQYLRAQTARVAPARSCIRQPGFPVATSPGRPPRGRRSSAPARRATSRLGEVVDAGGAAARRGIAVGNELQAGDAREHSPRRGRDALAVDEVARIVVAERAFEGRAGSAGPTSSRNSHTSRTRPRAAPPGRASGRVAQRGAAARGVDHHGVDLAGAKAATFPAASSCAESASPAWAWSAPQQPWPEAPPRRSPSRASTRSRRRVHAPKSSGMTHPLEERDAPALGPHGGHAAPGAGAARRRRHARQRARAPRGAAAAASARRAIEAEALRERRGGRMRGERCRGRGTMRRSSERSARFASPSSRRPARSTSSRVRSTIAPYATPEGQTVSQRGSRGTGGLLAHEGVERQAALGDAAHQVDRARAATMSRGRSRDRSGSAGQAQPAVDTIECPRVDVRASGRADLGCRGLRSRLRAPPRSGPGSARPRDRIGLQAPRAAPRARRARRTRRGRASPRGAQLAREAPAARLRRRRARRRTGRDVARAGARRGARPRMEEARAPAARPPRRSGAERRAAGASALGTTAIRSRSSAPRATDEASAASPRALPRGARLAGPTPSGSRARSTHASSGGDAPIALGQPARSRSTRGRIARELDETQPRASAGRAAAAARGHEASAASHCRPARGLGARSASPGAGATSAHRAAGRGRSAPRPR